MNLKAKCDKCKTIKTLTEDESREICQTGIHICDKCHKSMYLLESKV